MYVHTKRYPQVISISLEKLKMEKDKNKNTSVSIVVVNVNIFIPANSIFLPAGYELTTVFIGNSLFLYMASGGPNQKHFTWGILTNQ